MSTSTGTHNRDPLVVTGRRAVRRTGRAAPAAPAGRGLPPLWSRQRRPYLLAAVIFLALAAIWVYPLVWTASASLKSQQTEHVLVDQATTGLCGPGGADVVATGNGPSRIFLHAWVCSEDNEPCRYDGVVADPNRTRVVYAAVLTWGDDGATPAVPVFLPPVR